MWAWAHIDKYMHSIKTAWLIVENSPQTSFRFSPASFCAPLALLSPLRNNGEVNKLNSCETSYKMQSNAALTAEKQT
jgi:hypothetical protein